MCACVCVGGMRVHLYFAEESVCVCVSDWCLQESAGSLTSVSINVFLL